MFRYKYNKFKNVTHKQKRKKGDLGEVNYLFGNHLSTDISQMDINGDLCSKNVSHQFGDLLSD